MRFALREGSLLVGILWACAADAQVSGEQGGIPLDATIDFEALFAEFGTFVTGRQTCEVEA